MTNGVMQIQRLAFVVSLLQNDYCPYPFAANSVTNYVTPEPWCTDLLKKV